MEKLINKTDSRLYLAKLIFSAYGIIIGIPLLLTLYGVYSSNGFLETQKIILKPKVILFFIFQIFGQLLFCHIIAPLTFRLIKKHSFILVGIMTVLISNLIIFIISIMFFPDSYLMIVAIIPSLLMGAIIGRLIRDKVR